MAPDLASRIIGKYVLDTAIAAGRQELHERCGAALKCAAELRLLQIDTTLECREAIRELIRCVKLAMLWHGQRRLVDT